MRLRAALRFPLAEFADNAVSGALALETLESALEILGLAYSYCGHVIASFPQSGHILLSYYKGVRAFCQLYERAFYAFNASFFAIAARS